MHNKQSKPSKSNFVQNAMFVPSFPWFKDGGQVDCFVSKRERERKEKRS